MQADVEVDQDSEVDLIEFVLEKLIGILSVFIEVTQSLLGLQSFFQEPNYVLGAKFRLELLLLVGERLVDLDLVGKRPGLEKVPVLGHLHLSFLDVGEQHVEQTARGLGLLGFLLLLFGDQQGCIVKNIDEVQLHSDSCFILSSLFCLIDFFLGGSDLSEDLAKFFTLKRDFLTIEFDLVNVLSLLRFLL